MTPARRRSVPALLTGVAVAGAAGWLVDLTVLWVLDRRVGVPTSLAAATGFLVAGAVNFMINRVVFVAGREHQRHSARYAVIFALNLAAVSVALPLVERACHHLARQADTRLLLAKIIVTAVLLPVNTVVYDRWVFARSVPSSDAEPGE